MMNLRIFQQESRRTMPFNGVPMSDSDYQEFLGNYSMGLVGEYFELMLACNTGDYDSIIKESGDVLHYCVGLLCCLDVEIDYELLYEVEVTDADLLAALCDILEMSKKHIYHKHDMNEMRLKEAVHTVIKLQMETSDKAEFKEIMQKNIDKLKTRYPDRFSSDASKKRVDVNEY